MSQSLILLAPLLVLTVVLLFSFAGCTPFDAAPDTTPPVTTTTDPYEVAIPKTAGFVAYWRLGEPSGPDAKDEGPNNLKGSYHGGVGFRSEVGALDKKEPSDRAPLLNGTNSYVEVPWDSRLNPGGSFSVEAWIQPGTFVAGGQTTQHVVASHLVSSNLDFGYELSVIRQPDPKPRIQGRICTGVATPQQAVEVVYELPDAQLGGPGNDWKHVVLTYDGASKTATLYVDTIARDSKTSDYTPNSGQPFRIGAGRTPAAATAAAFYSGAIDEVALYNVALGVADIAAHFHLSGR